MSEASDANMKISVGRKQAELSENVNHPAEADIPEEILRGLCASLPSLVNLRCGKRLGKWKFGVFHHAAPHQRNKQNSENAAHHDQRSGFPVCVCKAKRGPRLGQQKRRKSKDCAS